VNKEWYKLILTHANRTKPETKIQDLFSNYRNNTGLSLTKLGLHVISSMNIEREEFRLPKVKITPRIRLLLDRYMQYPYYFDKQWLILFSTEDRIFYKMYGKDWDNFLSHMEENL
tara:strand:- start:718 stop:1062 length:345 start_codon:yes stop_codon:yes gene_type:complete